MRRSILVGFLGVVLLALGVPASAHVAAGIAITPAALPNTPVRTAYKVALGATGGTSPFSWTVSAGTLPAGLTLSKTGVISGTPSAVGHYGFMVKVTDSAVPPATATQAYTLIVTVLILPLKLAPAPLAAPYTANFGAVGATSPLHWKVSAGNLPPGLSLSVSGKLTGSAAVGGNYSFTVKLTDSAVPAHTPQRHYTLVVSNVRRYTDPSMNILQGITADPDGNLWFTNTGNWNDTTSRFVGSSIGRITPAGVVTNFPDPRIGNPMAITAGPDGNIWFTDYQTDSIGKITTAGVITIYKDPTIDTPLAITVGPDDNLWFTNHGYGHPIPSIGKITTAGVVTAYTDPSIRAPFGIAVGADGNLWFADYGPNNSVWKITTAGVFSKYTDPTIDWPTYIAAGPDGALWFVSADNESIGRITTTGSVTTYPVPSSGRLLGGGMTAGPDGAMWFTYGGSIGRITTTAPITVTTRTDPSVSNPQGITGAPDGAIWFTDGKFIDRIAIPSAHSVLKAF